MIEPLRGQVYWCDLSGVGRKPFLVVSNNKRNRQLDSVLAARITTTAKPSMPSVIELPQGEPVVGRVLCDDIVELYRDEIEMSAGALSPPTMRLVNRGLMVALALAP